MFVCTGACFHFAVQVNQEFVLSAAALGERASEQPSRPSFYSLFVFVIIFEEALL